MVMAAEIIEIMDNKKPVITWVLLSVDEGSKDEGSG